MPLLEIKSGKVEEVTPFSHKYELIIADNCAHCMNQLNQMKDCVADRDVIVLMENLSKLSEDKLKRLVAKKKIPYSAYLLDSAARAAYEFKGVTPMMWITGKDSKKSFTGVVSCDSLKLNF